MKPTMKDLPEWIYKTAFGDAEQCCRMRNALAIAWEAMYNAEYYDSMSILRVRDAMRRIEELGKQ